MLFGSRLSVCSTAMRRLGAPASCRPRLRRLARGRGRFLCGAVPGRHYHRRGASSTERRYQTACRSRAVTLGRSAARWQGQDSATASTPRFFSARSSASRIAGTGGMSAWQTGEMAGELILLVRGSWVPLAEFQAAVGRIIATGLSFVPTLSRRRLNSCARACSTSSRTVLARCGQPMSFCVAKPQTACSAHLPPR